MIRDISTDETAQMKANTHFIVKCKNAADAARPSTDETGTARIIYLYGQVVVMRRLLLLCLKWRLHSTHSRGLLQ
jgi:hypothetical protein